MADTHTYKFNVSMSCSGCSGAVDRVLKKLDGEPIPSPISSLQPRHPTRTLYLMPKVDDQDTKKHGQLTHH